VSVTEGYLEIGVPLLKDKPLFQELSTTFAGRVTDYSQSGVVETWKAGINWTINDDLRFRGTMSSDIRAPTVIELFNTAQVSRGTYTLPASTAPVRITGAGQNVSIGNPNLSPEEARTYVAGAVFSPRFIPGFQASVDWYKIKLLGSIESTNGQQSIDRCYAGDQTYCALLKVNGTQKITTTVGLTAGDFIEATQALLNQPSQQSTTGVDFEGAYRTGILGGNLNLRLTGTRLLTWFDPNNGCAAGANGSTKDFVGAAGACGTYPKLTMRGSANYTVGRWGLYVQERFISAAQRNPNYVTGVDISNNDIPAFWYTDATVQFDVGAWKGGSGQLYFTVQNLFDKDPPNTNSTAGRSWVDPTTGAVGLYDPLGQRYVAGLRYKF
jgi:outer membrane receptor protein involved in Fe transport